MKTVEDNSLLLAALIFLIQCTDEKMILAAIAAGLFFWYLRFQKRGILIVFAVFMLILPGRIIHHDASAMTAGRVIEVKEKYIVVQNGFNKAILYTEEQPLFDSIIKFDAELNPIEKTQGFFKFDFQDYYLRKGVEYAGTVTSYTVLKQLISFRASLQNKIQKFDRLYEKAMLKGILLSIRADETGLKSMLNQSAFALGGILSFLSFCLKFFFDRKQVKQIIFVCTAILAILYSFPLLLVQRIILHLLDKRCDRLSVKYGIGFSVIMIIYPESVISAAFLIPCMFRLTRYYSVQTKRVSLIFGMIIQSILFQSINIIQMLIYPVLLMFLGILWFAALIAVFIPTDVFFQMVRQADAILSYAMIFSMPGSVMGFGLAAYCSLLLLLRKSRYFWNAAIAMLLLFQVTGMFHPLAECTFINVGQGDCILIRAPFNMHNILIDTGKPSQLNTVQTYLNAKSITELHTMIITHSDSDHSGNAEILSESFHTSQYIPNHTAEIAAGPFMFYDLNTIANEDQNQSSIVIFTEINKLKILLMGDADKITEEEIIRNFGNLEADILKLSHHGSKTGSSDKFLNQVKPSLAVISCGSYNLYHHPSIETMKKLEIRDIQNVLTKSDGDISIFFLPGLNLFLTSTGKIGIIPSI